MPGDIGRRYGAVSGDRNPIHLYPLSAKLFGFKRQIAHGMWSKARCLAELQNQLPEDAFTVDVQFKLPMFVPATVKFENKPATAAATSACSPKTASNRTWPARSARRNKSSDKLQATSGNAGWRRGHTATALPAICQLKVQSEKLKRKTEELYRFSYPTL